MLLALIRKELQALRRDLHGIGALFVMPAMFIVIMSLALKDLYAPPVGNLHYALELRDSSPLAQQFARQWQASHGTPAPLPANWPTALRQGQLRYVVVIEDGFATTLDSPQPPEGVKARLFADPGLDQSLFIGLHAELAGSIGELRATAVQERFMGFVPAGSHAIRRLVSAERAGAEIRPPTAVQQNVPAWLVFGIFFVVTSIAGLFVQEHRDGTLARLASIGVPHRVQILAKALPYLGVNAVQAALMFAVGIYVMPLVGGEALSLAGISWPALFLMLLGVSLAAVGFALFLACLVRTHAQANALGPMCNILMAAVGGIMVPTFVMPPVMQTLAALSPMNWGLEGLLTVLLRQGGPADILPFLARLLLFAGVMLFAASRIFPQRIKP